MSKNISFYFIIVFYSKLTNLISRKRQLRILVNLNDSIEIIILFSCLQTPHYNTSKSYSTSDIIFSKFILLINSYLQLVL